MQERRDRFQRRCSERSKNIPWSKQKRVDGLDIDWKMGKKHNLGEKQTNI
jgi:hypothetical protein